MREELGLADGSKVLFVRVNDSLMLKKVNMQTFEEITKPLKEEAKRLGLKESDAVGMVHRARQKK
jgi:bifunctional DNA-binding transcriptional regulator/antitoxin component of YhaV-PrlF toxin-antitoxin module